MKRRNLIRAMLAGALGITLLSPDAVAVFEGFNRGNEISHNIYKPKLLGKKTGHTIVHLSDIHVDNEGGPFMTPLRLEKAVNDINNTLNTIGANASKTLLAFTGDLVNKLVNGRFETDLNNIEGVAKSLSNIAADNKVGVLGNHDLDHRQTNKVVALLESAGITVLGEKSYTDRRFDHLPFNVLGLPDYTIFPEWYTPDNIAKATRSIDPEKSTVANAHNASGVDLTDLLKGVRLVNKQKILTLSGHTHGLMYAPSQSGFGRFAFIQRLLGFGAGLAIGYNSKYINGFYETNEADVLVSGGIGNHPEAKNMGVRTVPAGVEILVL